MSYPKKMKGIVKRHPDGFGFFIADDPTQADAYIPAHFMKDVMTHDRVTAMVYRENRKERFWAKIISIDERHWKTIVGPLTRRNYQWVICDQEGAWGQDVWVQSDGLPWEREWQERQLAVVTLLSYPDSPKGLVGKVIKLLGPIENAAYDVERVARSLNIPFDFPSEVLQEAQTFSTQVTESDWKGRADLRHLPFVTIDGATAKDFDDAIFVKNQRSSYQLLVAIADVSAYVKPQSAIDREAYDRGTSCYFPNFVIPMLPEILSNELCSLKPNVPRLAFVCDMLIDRTGQLKKFSFYEAVIQSHARLTYGMAQEIIDRGLWPDGMEPSPHSRSILKMLKIAAQLAQLLLDRRLKLGSLDLEIPETEVLVDGLGNPIEILKTRRLFAHRLIEEFMLMANMAAALMLDQSQLPGIYRIHETPKEDQIEHLARFAKGFGVRINPRSSKLQLELRQALQKVNSPVHGEILSNLILRSMKQARYSSENVGHFGLAFSHYTHLTSPIRRYPDLIAHRLIKALLTGQKRNWPSADELEAWCTWLSSTEQRAMKAERQVIAIKKARFIENFIGHIFNGVVTGVTKFGLFVTLREFEVDGLIHVEQLSSGGQGEWEFNEETLSLTERRSGFTYRLGDRVMVRVMSSNISEGKIDFTLAQDSLSKLKTIKSGSSSSQQLFDPGQKLIEALQKRG
ncbi:MAG: ribonuclease R, partial [Bdellovibrionaceae bacterium]|nr:ribonuclease R [Pseudobdellovibrionaceae bacterium]